MLLFSHRVAMDWGDYDDGAKMRHRDGLFFLGVGYRIVLNWLLDIYLFTLDSFATAMAHLI